eukprot:RCo016204
MHDTEARIHTERNERTRERQGTEKNGSTFSPQQPLTFRHTPLSPLGAAAATMSVRVGGSLVRRWRAGIPRITDQAGQSGGVLPSQGRPRREGGLVRTNLVTSPRGPRVAATPSSRVLVLGPVLVAPRAPHRALAVLAHHVLDLREGALLQLPRKHRKQQLGLLNALQGVRPQVLHDRVFQGGAAVPVREVKPVEEIHTDQDLPPHRLRGDPRREVHRGPEVVHLLVSYIRLRSGLTEVHSHSHSQASPEPAAIPGVHRNPSLILQDSRWPRRSEHRDLNLEAHVQGILGVLEDHEEAVPGGGDLVASELSDCRPHHVVVHLQGLGHVMGHLLPELGGVLDVREEHRHHALRSQSKELLL